MSHMRKFITLVEGNLLTEMPRLARTSPEEFIAMVKKMFPSIDKQKILSKRDLDSVASANNIPLPSIFMTQKQKWANPNKPSLWDLSGTGSSGSVDTSDIEADTGEDVETEPLTARDEDERLLQKARSFRNIASKGLITILGRSPKGKFVRMPGAEELAAQLERMLSRQLHANGDSTMEEQYEDLTDKVKLKMNYLNMSFIPPNGESQNMVERRASEWLDNDILYNKNTLNAYIEKRAPLDIIAFSHGMTIKSLLHYIIGFDKSFLWKIEIDNTSVSKLSFDETGWRLHFINNTSHLFKIY